MLVVNRSYNLDVAGYPTRTLRFCCLQPKYSASAVTFLPMTNGLKIQKSFTKVVKIQQV